MKTLLTSTIFILLFTFAASAQTEEKVEILQSTANACAECFTVRKALEDENKVLKSSVESLKAEISKLQIEKTQYFAELQTTKAEAARYFSLVQLCVQKGRVKQFGLFNTKIGGN